MVKSKTKITKKLNVKPKTMKKSKPKKRQVFGPISTIDTAPVAIGNTMTGAKPILIPLEDGMRVQGRDYLIEIDPTDAAITGWTMVGGAAISPTCMVASTLKHFSNTYAHYMVHGVAFHYLTASSTTNNGSILFYMNKDRAGPGLPTDSSNFLPVVLSDHHTLIGPLWKNATASFFPEPNWYPTDLFCGETLANQCPGELFMFTKTVSEEVPGYIVVDYDITFRGMSVNPKSGLLPVSRMKYTQIALNLTATAVTIDVSEVEMNTNATTLLDGVTTSATPPGGTIGDIYKFIVNEDDSSFTNVTAATMFRREFVNGTAATEPITDGFTCYAVLKTATIMALYPNLASATANQTLGTYFWGVTATVTVTLRGYLSLVGSYGSIVAQANI